jgi:N6-adenosine-specific RNA methylase IME4
MTTLRAVRQELKRQRRERLVRELVVPPFPTGQYGVIYADPPWQFRIWSTITGADRSAENHYPTMGLEEIVALPVRQIAARDCALFLWVPNTMLIRFAPRVIEGWGFVHKSTVTWDKLALGTGYNFRSQTEQLLYCTRGKVRAPAPHLRVPTLIRERRGRHSAKPIRAYEIVETYFPGQPKIELFARGPARPGWITWGPEAQQCPGNDAGPSRRRSG